MWVAPFVLSHSMCRLQSNNLTLLCHRVGKQAGRGRKEDHGVRRAGTAWLRVSLVSLRELWLSLLVTFRVWFSLQASRCLSYLIYPLCLSGAVFSLAYLRQKRWTNHQHVHLVVNWTKLAVFSLLKSQMLHNYLIHSTHIHTVLTVTIPGWSAPWSLVSCVIHLRCAVAAPRSHAALSVVGVYALGFLSMVPQLFVNHKVGQGGVMQTCCLHCVRINALLSLFAAHQLRSVSHLQGAVLMYRVSALWSPASVLH